VIHYLDISLRTLLVAGVSVAITAPFAVYLGYVLARRRFRGKALLETIAMLPLVLPPVVTGFFLLYLLAPRGPIGFVLNAAFGIRIPFTLTAAVLAAGLVSFPLFLRGTKVGFAAVPRELEEMASTLGHRPAAVFRKVSFPLARHGILAGMLLAFARALGEFGATLVVAGNIPGRTQTLPLAIYQATLLGDATTGWILITIAALIAMVLMLAASKLERM
jgi:molybdate transport system permease protein